MNTTGCLICGAELAYKAHETTMRCEVCKAEFPSNARCAAGHFVCDECHRADALSYIERYCLGAVEADPQRLAVEILANSAINMHDPEHHFLVPAVLLSSYFAATNGRDKLPAALAAARTGRRTSSAASTGSTEPAARRSARVSS
jgi:hypothetical protein